MKAQSTPLVGVLAACFVVSVDELAAGSSRRRVEWAQGPFADPRCVFLMPPSCPCVAVVPSPSR